MTDDFAIALLETERELDATSGWRAARERVAMRLRGPGERGRFPSWRRPAFALAVCGVCVAGGYALAMSMNDAGAGSASLVADDLPRGVGVAADPGAEPGAELTDLMAASPSSSAAASLPSPSLSSTPVAPTGQLSAGQFEDSCAFVVGERSYGTMSELNISLPPGFHDVTCRRGMQVQHQRLEIVAGKTTRVVFRFGQNTVEDPAHAAQPVEGERGSLVAFAIGGSCMLTVDGASQGVRASLRMKVAPGRHVVRCETGDGRSMTQSVRVTTDRPGIASFRLPFETRSVPEPPRAAPEPTSSSRAPTNDKRPDGVFDPWR